MLVNYTRILEARTIRHLYMYVYVRIHMYIYRSDVRADSRWRTDLGWTAVGQTSDSGQTADGGQTLVEVDDVDPGP